MEKSDLLSSLYKSKAKKCAIFFSTVFNFPPLKKLNCFFIKRKSLLCSKKLEEWQVLLAPVTLYFKNDVIKLLLSLFTTLICSCCSLKRGTRAIPLSSLCLKERKSKEQKSKEQKSKRAKERIPNPRIMNAPSCLTLSSDQENTVMTLCCYNPQQVNISIIYTVVYGWK